VVRNAVIAIVLAVGFVSPALSQHEPVLDEANNNIADLKSLQRGAKYFVNYCLGCHSAKYVRYNRLAQDLQLSAQQLDDNLMFTGEQAFDLMEIAMRPDDAARWFTVAPPDLSLIARSRGTDYIYTYLRSFYVAPDRPAGVDNVVMPGTNMPHVLWQLQGTQRAVFHSDEHNAEVLEGFETVTPGELDAEAFDEAVRDIVNFLDYIGEPIKRQRQQLGIRVIGFLLVFLLIAYMLKKEIWKDVK
jgi:ubiquinol-cytochrome c reductase cytochrome c1 subunit